MKEVLTLGKWSLGDVEKLARKILFTYFCESDVEFMISTFAEDIIWLGGGAAQKAEGRERAAAFFRAGKDEMIPFDMYDEQYETMDLGGGCYLCEGVGRLKVKEGRQLLMDTVQRVTFVFRENGDRLETVHIHNSIPFAAMGEKELFPVHAARAAYEELESRLKRREEEYDQQARFLSQLYDTVSCGIIQFATDDSHSIVSINRKVWELYGFRSEEHYRREVRNPFQLVEKKDAEKIHRLVDNLTLNGRSVVYTRECRRLDGEPFWISVSMGRIRNAAGQEVYQAVFTDITQMKRLEQEQEKERVVENRSLKAAICMAYPLIMSVNLTRDTFNCFIDTQESPMQERQGSFEVMVRESARSVYPSYQEDFLHKFGRKEILRRFAEGEREVYMELQTMAPDGRYHWIAVHIIYVDNPYGGDVLAIDLIKVLDAQRSEQARQEQLLRDALASAKAANRAKSDFLSRMSHDIRTPMNAIIGMTSIGQIKADSPEAVRDCFYKIDASSRYLLSLINDILDMSRIETGKMVIAHEQFCFPDFIEEINQIIYPQTLERELGYEVCLGESLEKSYIGDPLRLKQILMNLLSNSLKFTPEGGSLSLGIRELKRTKGFAYLQIQVKDTGIGMSEEFQKKVFQPFEQESEESARNNVGSGLGLSIVYNLVQLMGGRIKVESRKNLGTTFTVTLPFKLAAQDGECEGKRRKKEPLKEKRMEGAAQERREMRFDGQTVLLVEDNDLNMEIAETILKMHGFCVETAVNGREAVELFGGSWEGRFSAVLMDIRMPVMDGLEATRAIRGMDRADAVSLPILAMTANAFEEDKALAYEAGMNGYLTKPLDVHKILEELGKYIG